MTNLAAPYSLTPRAEQSNYPVAHGQDGNRIKAELAGAQSNSDGNGDAGAGTSAGVAVAV